MSASAVTSLCVSIGVLTPPRLKINRTLAENLTDPSGGMVGADRRHSTSTLRRARNHTLDGCRTVSDRPGKHDQPGSPIRFFTGWVPPPLSPLHSLRMD